jgi:Ni/Co efflux regulator RcnB
MRKIVLIGLIAAAAYPAAAQAQSRQEIQQDRREIQEQRNALRDAQRRGDRNDIREEREDIRDARRELREDQRDRQTQYVSPYSGWRYSTLRPGARVRTSVYGTRYVIVNPNTYGLRPMGRYQRWIRYGNDIVLVNTRTGRVVQVLRNRYR